MKPTTRQQPTPTTVTVGGRTAQVLYPLRGNEYAGRGRCRWFVRGYAVRWDDTGEEGYVPRAQAEAR